MESVVPAGAQESHQQIERHRRLRVEAGPGWVPVQAGGQGFTETNRLSGTAELLRNTQNQSGFPPNGSQDPISSVAHVPRASGV